MKWLTLNDYRASNELHTVAVISWHFWMIIRPEGTKLFHFNPSPKRCPLNCYFSSFFTPSVLQTMLPRKKLSIFSLCFWCTVTWNKSSYKILNLIIKLLLSFWVDCQFWVVVFEVVTAPSKIVLTLISKFMHSFFILLHIWRSRKTPQAIGMVKLKCASLE